MTLSPQELAAICDPENQGALLSQVRAACYETDSAGVDKFLSAYQVVCKRFPQIAGQPELDLLARAYRAANPQLPKPPSSSGAEAAPRVARGDHIEAQGLSGTVLAQGIGDFLVSRAEKEVSAFATVELFSQLCARRTRDVFPQTCELLEGQDHGANPIGLGLLRRTVVADLERLPEHLLRAALARIKKEMSGAARANAIESLCVADIGYALTRALGDGRTLDEIFTNPASTGLNLLKSYAALVSECTPVWQRFESGAQRGTALYQAIQRLNLAKTPEERRAARAEVIEAAIAIVKATAPQHENLLDEFGELTLAVWNQDWIAVVRAASSAPTLGPLLLCSVEDSSCKRDEKVRLVLSIGADIATADSSDQVQAALNRVVEPVGSWRRKFGEPWTFSLTLQGYVGGKVAHEEVIGITPPGVALAPVLAIGIEPTFNYSRTGRVGLFVQLIDVGNFASIHLASEDEDSALEVEMAPDIAVSQLFAPGAYAIWTPAKVPFVLGLGFDWVPLLRETPQGARSAWHVGGFLAVDVPILELAHE